EQAAGGQHLARELDLAAAERSPCPQPARPGAPESEELPDAVQLEAAGLHGVTREVTREVPVIRRHGTLGDGHPALSAVALEVDDPIEHQHGRERAAGGASCPGVRDDAPP